MKLPIMMMCSDPIINVIVQAKTQTSIELAKALIAELAAELLLIDFPLLYAQTLRGIAESYREIQAHIMFIQLGQ